MHSAWPWHLKKDFEKYGLDIAPLWIREVRNPGPYFSDRLFFFWKMCPPFLIPTCYDLGNTLHFVAMGVAAQKLSQEDQGQSDLFRLDMMLKMEMPCVRYGHGI